MSVQNVMAIHLIAFKIIEWLSHLLSGGPHGTLFRKNFQQ